MSYHHDSQTFVVRATSEPFAEAVDLQEARDHLRLDGDGEDALVAGWITAARRLVEDQSLRSIVTQTFETSLDRFPQALCGAGGGISSHLDRRAIILPRMPLQSVSSIAYVDAAGATQTLSAANYRVDVKSEPPRITPAYGLAWPVTRIETGAVTVTFIAGQMTPFTASGDTMTALGRTYTDGDVLRLKNSGGSLPAGLLEQTAYYVVSASGATFKLALTANGSAITTTDAGQGTHFASNPSSGLSEIEGLRAAIKLLVGHWNENREAVGTVGEGVEIRRRTPSSGSGACSFNANPQPFSGDIFNVSHRQLCLRAHHGQEVLDTNVPAASATGKTITHSGYNTSATLNAAALSRRPSAPTSARPSARAPRRST
jgi:uncharacterized phiE125 gp8 family phage protein